MIRGAVHCICILTGVTLGASQQNFAKEILSALQSVQSPQDSSNDDAGLSLLEVDGSSFTRLPIETSMLLTQVEKAAEKSVNELDLDNSSTAILVTVTQDITDTVLPSIFGQHNISVAAIQSAFDRLAACDTARQYALDNNVSTLNTSVIVRRETHRNCRIEELNCTNSSQADGGCGGCDALWNFIIGPATVNGHTFTKENRLVEPANSYTIDPTCTSPTSAEPTSGVDTYLSNLITWSSDRERAFNDSLEECLNATNNLYNKSHLCRDNQKSFENTFCQFKHALNGVCSTYDSCFEGANDTFNEVVAEQQKLNRQLRNEFISLKKITCFLDVITGDHNDTAHQSAKLSACRSLYPDTSELDLNISATPNMTDCDTSDVAVYPGYTGNDTSWYEQEYASHDWANLTINPSVISCSSEWVPAETNTSSASNDSNDTDSR